MFSELQTKAAPELKEQLELELLQCVLVPEMQYNTSVIAEALDGLAWDSHNLYLSLKRCLSEFESCWDILHPLCRDGTICDTTPPSPSENLMAGAL